MARIRTVKPEMPQDVKLASCSRDARYTFVLLITQADDEGLIPGAPRQLLGLLYPHDEDVASSLLIEWVEELVGIGAVRWRATLDGAPVLELSNWSKHQRVDNKGRSQLAGFLAPLAEVRGDSPPLAEVRGLDLGPRTKDQGPRRGSTPARGASEAEAHLEEQCGRYWPDVVRFLDARPPGKRAEWAAEALRIIGPVTGNTPEDLARACREGALASPPVTSARALQAFTTMCRRDRVNPIGVVAINGQRPSKQEIGRANTAAWLAKKELEQEPA